ncbi:ribosome small subunit-dependent GTPase A [Agrococcus sp. TF02-05]|uniref:ribosome small subunit-dependent GTPase A n=1 Tax=Agrococcus sp. TF02-05 TaxID=2815211 RepID=UPI001AA1B43D|nr:ribosome small subunit-dependent GTPase A [Agrococcus sp. TF02-05]MBO1771154.1 ribosome small subunit-dependent GTPase A [Agrococcus sp. TF02-05]
MSWLGDYEDPYEEYDESSVRERPNPKANRPRSKHRPEHDDAITGIVTAVDRGRYTLAVRVGEPDEAVVTAARARELRKQAIVAGDRVDVVGDTSGEEGSLARIVRIQPRSTVLRRSADDTDVVERVIVANADVLLMVVAAADPEPRPALVDRYLVAALDAGITPVMVVTKTDVADPAPFLAHFEGLDIEVWQSSLEDPPVEALRERLDGHTTVAVGHSGVGKSTLVNALVPGAMRAVGHVNAVTGRGRHTSSSTVSFKLGSGWIIDTPGVRSFGLGHVATANVLSGFPDLAAVAEDCPRGCSHLPGEEYCELTIAALEGRLGQRRVDSMQRLLGTLVAARQQRHEE